MEGEPPPRLTHCELASPIDSFAVLLRRISRGVYDRINGKSIALSNFCDAVLVLRIPDDDLRRFMSHQVSLLSDSSDCLRHFSARDLARFVTLCRNLGYLTSDRSAGESSHADEDGSISEWLTRSLTTRLSALPQAERERVLPFLPRTAIASVNKQHRALS